MKCRREWLAASAVLASTAGIGFSSGRQVVLFFAQMGWASWIGIAFSSAAFGLLCGMICRFARQTSAKSLAAVFIRVLDFRQSVVVSALHGLLAAFTAGTMIAACGTLTALTLPIHNAFWLGVVFSVGLALLLCMQRMRRFAVFGALTLLLCAIFYAALALDPRDVQFHHRYVTVPELDGNITAALLLSILHAALSASIAGEAVVCFADLISSPARFSFQCGGLMFALLAVVNTALLRGGDRLLSQELPTVLLAARWGVFGYYASLIAMWLCSIATLTAALSALVGRHGEPPRAKGVLAAVLLISTAFAAAIGFERFAETAAPLLGCAAAFTLCGLICCSGFAHRQRPSAQLQNMTKYRVKLYEPP